MIELYVKRDKTAEEEEGARRWSCKSEESGAKKRTGFQAPVRIRRGPPNAIATTPSIICSDGPRSLALQPHTHRPSTTPVAQIHSTQLLPRKLAQPFHCDERTLATKDDTEAGEDLRLQRHDAHLLCMSKRVPTWPCSAIGRPLRAKLLMVFWSLRIQSARRPTFALQSG